MVDKTGYFVDPSEEEKYLVIGPNSWIKTEATELEMLLWREWEFTLTTQRRTLDTITERLGNLLTKATEAKNSSEPV